ncbi:unnamed protein product [Sphagnum balticum]
MESCPTEGYKVLKRGDDQEDLELEQGEGGNYEIDLEGGENEQGEGKHGEDESTSDGGEDGEENNNLLLEVED